MPAVSRRGFLRGCSASIAAMAGARISGMALAGPERATDHVLLVVFLRGGWDGLTVVPPLAGDDRRRYEEARRTLALPQSGNGASLPLDGRFGLHPAMAPLHELYRMGKVAFVHAAGLPVNTRSHFDAMAFMELGTPGSKTQTTGWLARHLGATGIGGAPMGVVAMGELPASLSGERDALVLNTLGDLTLPSAGEYAETLRPVLRSLYGGDSVLDGAARRTLDALDLIERLPQAPDDSGAGYPANAFGVQLHTIAQVIKLDLGLQAATIDFGGWDTHEQQGEAGGGYIDGLLGAFSSGLAAFYNDLERTAARRLTDRITIVVMSEFGRRVGENASGGTDHGHGSVMLVVGGRVRGGRVYGDWPGLHEEQLFDRADLAITTDYRQVLAEVLIQQAGSRDLGAIFPGLDAYQPLGLV